jgi:hypothetical protein
VQYSKLLNNIPNAPSVLDKCAIVCGVGDKHATIGNSGEVDMARVKKKAVRKAAKRPAKRVASKRSAVSKTIDPAVVKAQATVDKLQKDVQDKAKAVAAARQKAAAAKAKAGKSSKAADKRAAKSGAPEKPAE